MTAARPIHSVYTYAYGLLGNDTASTSSLVILFRPFYQWAAMILIFAIRLLPRIYRSLDDLSK